MKRIKILFSLIAFVAIMVSCNKDEASSADGFATVSFRNIGIDSEVISTLTPSRSGDNAQTDEDVSGGNDDSQENTGGSDGSENGGTETEEPFDPVAEALKNGFKLSVKAYDETVYACTDYEKFNNGECENVELRVGNYTVVADMGNPEVEGFDQPYYSGSKDIHLEKGDNVDVELECKLANSILKINYTDNFKKYFFTYSSYVSTSKGNTVEYVQDETRGAYLASGEVTVYVKAKKTGANEATLNVGKYTLNPQYEYALTLDVDVSKAVMTVTFSEDINEEPISIDISDAALNANPPYMTGEGFENIGSVVEGAGIDGNLRVIINAEAGIASCVMATTSAYLKEKGWSENTDLSSADEQTVSTIKGTGVELKGFAGSNKMAYIDFTELLRTLPKDNPVDIKLTVTDKLNKTSDVFSFNVEAQDCMFSVYPTDEEAPFLGNECKVNVTLLDGDANNIKFALTDGGAPLSVQKISEPIKVGELNQYTVFLKGTDDVQFINPFKVNAKYLTYNKDTETDLNVSYGILLDNGEGDVWAKRAYMHVYNVPQNEMQSLKVQKKEINGDWTDIDIQNLEVSGTNLIAKGLSSNTQQQLRVVKDGKEPTNILDVKTEEDKQIPNNGFEEWRYETKHQGSDWFGFDVYYYYPNNNVDESWWSTNNERAQAWTVSPVSVTTCPAVYFTSDAYSGNKAVELHTSGHGGEYASTSFSIYPESAFPASIFIGTYKWENKAENKVLGHSFESRPLSIVFFYKYKPYNSDSFKVLVSLKNNDITIAESEYVHELTQVEDSDYRKCSIALNYSNYILKATSISIEFFSTNKTSFSKSDFIKNGTIYLPTDNGSVKWNAHYGSTLKIDDLQLIYE
ncbi:DUF4493 domain-containing protein [uncultured Bacteroides sp.]|uniref:DUF4493 domain-containing protein n=1 Tax=uncultured Bacteroides sp. TaxID=162156 RepID=UPI0025DC0947|nr:DUF4493 domain-containing protein [uncultured Bacteroides sp.]